MRKALWLLLAIPLGYLTQACILPYIKLAGMTPNVLFVIIGIVTVAYGKLRAFWVGCIYGLLTEIMMPGITYFNLALYSLCSLFCSFPFADKALKRLEYERALNRKHRELSALTRTMLCILCNITVFEIFNVGYITIGGTALTFRHIQSALAAVAGTGVLAILLMLPMRRLIFGKWDRVRSLIWLRNRLRHTRA